MAKEIRHKDAGEELWRVEDNEPDRHYMDGGADNDILVYNTGTASLNGKTPTELLAILSGQAGAPFDFNGQEITSATLNAMVAKGTWTASGTWTIPAHDVTGIISAKAHINMLEGTQLNSQTNNGAFIIVSNADSDARSSRFSLPASGNYVPIWFFGKDIRTIDFGAAGLDFSGVTQPLAVIVDADLDSWVAIGFLADDRPALTVGGSAGVIEFLDTQGLGTGISAADYFHVDAYNTNDAARAEAYRITNSAVASGLAIMEVTADYYMVEKAAAGPDIAGRGQLWAETIQGTKPMYTTDTGLDGSLNRTIFVQTATVTTASSDTETLLHDGGVGTLTIPANTLHVGSVIRIEMGGVYSSKATGSGDLTINCKLGGVSIGTHVESMSNNETNQPWILRVIITVRSIGAGGTIIGDAHWLHEFAQAGEITQMGDFAVMGTVACDTTGTLAIECTGQFSLSDVANSISTYMGVVEILN